MKKIFYTLSLIFVLTACVGNKSKGNSADNTSDHRLKSEQLFSLLRTNEEKGIMVGHRDALAYGSMWYGEEGRCDMKSVCDDYPAIMEWDLGYLEAGSAFNIDSVEFNKLKNYIRVANSQGGISTLKWSVTNPAGSQDVSVVSAILKENKYNTTYVAYLERLAEFLLDLRDEKGSLIPVILNLFNNPNLPDNWWSTEYCDPEEYKGLWKMTVNYLKNERNINHVLFAYSIYNPKNIHEIETHYPGDEYVDIIGVNNYLILKEDPSGRIYQQDLNNNLALLVSFAESRHKIAALMDTGLEGVKLPNYFSVLLYPVLSQYKISYVVFGKNSWNIEEQYHIPIPGHPASEDFIKFVNTPRILTLGKLNDGQ